MDRNLTLWQKRCVSLRNIVPNTVQQSVYEFAETLSPADVFTRPKGTVDQTAAAEQTHRSITFPGNSIAVNSWFRWTLWGDVDTPAGGAVTFQLALRQTSITGPVLMLTNVTANASMTQAPWRSVYEINYGGPLGTMCNVDFFHSLIWTAGTPAYNGQLLHSPGSGADTAHQGTVLFDVAIPGAPAGVHFRTYAGLLEQIQ